MDKSNEREKTLGPKDTLVVTVESVRRAAETCGDAKKTLQALFPDAFKQTEWETVPTDKLKLVYLDDPSLGSKTIMRPGPGYFLMDDQGFYPYRVCLEKMSASLAHDNYDYRTATNGAVQRRKKW